MLRQPRDERLELAIGEEIDDTVPLEVDQNAAVALAATAGEDVDAEDARIAMLSQRGSPNNAKQRVGTPRHCQAMQHASACFATQGKSDQLACFMEPSGATGIGSGDAR
jgi:hypothetical protein